MKNRALFNIIFASALWGTSGVGGRYLIDKYKIPAISIGSYRVVLACIFLWLTTIKTKRKLNIETKKDYGLLFIYGLLVATYQLTYFTAVKTGPVSIVSIITLCLAPLFVLLFQVILNREDINLRLVLSLFFCICGVILLSNTNGDIYFSKTTFILSCAAAVSYGSNNIICKELVLKYDYITVATLSFSIAAVFLSPFLKINVVNFEVIMVLLYLGVFSGYLASVLFLKGIKEVNPLVASILTIIEPLTTTLLSVIIFTEYFGLLQIIGSLFIIIMLLLVFTDKSDIKNQEMNIKTME